MDFKETGCELVEWAYVAQDNVSWGLYRTR